MFTDDSEAYDSAYVVPIHTRSELSSDSDSTYDSASVASVASVNQPLILSLSQTSLNGKNLLPANKTKKPALAIDNEHL